MKGLFVKDFRLLMLQKSFLLLILAIAVGMMAFTDDVVFPVVFLTFVVSVFTVSTISYDDLDNGNAFLFTLPVTRNDYVIEKYALGLLSGGMAWIFATAAGMLTAVWKGSATVTDFMLSSLFLFSLMIIVQAVMFPFQLKFGSDTGRIAMIGTFGALAVIALAIVKGARAVFNIDLVHILDHLPAVSMGMLVIIAVIIALLLLFLSLKISLSVMNRKEF